MRISINFCCLLFVYHGNFNNWPRWSGGTLISERFVVFGWGGCGFSGDIASQLTLWRSAKRRGFRKGILPLRKGNIKIMALHEIHLGAPPGIRSDALFRRKQFFQRSFDLLFRDPMFCDPGFLYCLHDRIEIRLLFFGLFFGDLAFQFLHFFLELFRFRRSFRHAFSPVDC